MWLLIDVLIFDVLVCSCVLASEALLLVYSIVGVVLDHCVLVFLCSVNVTIRLPFFLPSFLSSSSFVELK